MAFEYTPEDLIESKVGVLLGIDEAGRGPVLGPMVYGTCFCPIDEKQKLAKLGFADSKVLTEAQRDVLFDKIKNKKAGISIGWMVEILQPDELSKKMLRVNKVNLNTISHDAAISLIKRTLAKGVNVKEIYVDTVGTPSKYQAKLKALFPDIEITVSKKADSLFPIVSAASICAKVIRDSLLRNWEYKEKDINSSTKFGSGYPSVLDPNTKNWLKNNIDSVFGYPSVMRFSWKTSDVLLEKGAVDVAWEQADLEDDKEYGMGMSHIKDRSDRYRYFAENNMELVMDFD